MHRLTVPSLVLGSLLFGACGFSSGLPADKQGKDLTPAENKQVCVATQEYLADLMSDDEQKHFVCIIGAQIASSLSPTEDKVAACKTAFDDCMGKEVEESNEEPGADCTERASDPNCTATVAELDACTEELAKAFVDYANDATCEEEAHEPEQGEACKAIKAKGCSV